MVALNVSEIEPKETKMEIVILFSPDFKFNTTPLNQKQKLYSWMKYISFRFEWYTRWI